MIVVIWIDWYAYHVARFRALASHPSLLSRVLGIELVGGTGVHDKLVFREEQRDGLSITTLLPQSGWKEAGQRQLAVFLWKKLNVIKPSVVLVPGYYTLPGLAAAAWAKIHGKRSVLMSESTAMDHKRHFWKELPKRMLLRTLFDWAVVGGKLHTDYLTSLGFRKARIARSYNVVDNHFYAAGVERLRATSSPQEHQLPSNYFLYVGRLAPEKNLDTLLTAFSEYRKLGGEWELVLVGDGPVRQQLEEAAAARDCSHLVHFAGMKNAAATLPFYAFASCFILPSTLEPWGLVLNEAMAAGLPVLASNKCGSANELVEQGANGFLFDPADTAALTGYMIRINRLDSDGRSEMGEHAASTVARYSPETWASEVARIVASA